MSKNIFIFFIFILFFFSKTSLLFSKQQNLKVQYILEKPYKIGKNWYYPKENYNYSETGIASVYPEIIDSQYTKNGEKYYKNKVSAAHKTLPLPSIVRVTNLQNGYSINVRVNDRGPRNNFRIIQLSKKAAKILKIKNYGLVSVEILPVLSMAEYKKLKKISNISNENLEKIDDLKKPLVKSENLILDKKNKENKKIKKTKKILPQTREKKDKLNFKKYTVVPVYLRIKIATFNNFEDAFDFKNKFKKIYDKILLSLAIVDNHQFYILKTVALKDIKEAEKILSIIQKKGYKNAKIIIEKK